MKNSGEWGFETYLVMSHKRAPVAFHQPTETKHYASKKIPIAQFSSSRALNTHKSLRSKQNVREEEMHAKAHTD